MHIYFFTSEPGIDRLIPDSLVQTEKARTVSINVLLAMR